MAEKQEEEKLLKDTISEERLQVCNVVRRLGSKLSGLMFTCGALVMIFGFYVLFAPQEPVPDIVAAIFTGALGFVAVLNILCGLLLLLGED
jgi:VIT1/CCC1 family predicted Fe2+/Mn2+ transporter